MIDVRPFKGVRYNTDSSSVKDLAKVTCPPYDVISSEEREDLYNRSDYNIVRLVLGKDNDEEADANDKYTKAADNLRQWLEHDILSEERQPAYYLYTQEFKIGDVVYSRTGFIGLVKLQQFSEGGILPHERTLSKPKEDRLKLIKACNANLSQIFGIYTDPACKADNVLNATIADSEPDSIVKDDNGVVNKVWVITDQNAIDVVSDAMKDRQVFIADGHHRYETALAYSKYERERLGDPDGELRSDFVMMMFVNMASPGLVVFPTHRVMHDIKQFDKAALLRGCDKYFTIEKAQVSALDDVNDMTSEDFLSDIAGDDSSETVFGLYMGKDDFYLLKLDDYEKVDALVDKAYSEAWRKLDVSILHSVMIGDVLGIDDEAQLMQTNIKYTRSLREAVALVDSGSHQCALLMNPTKVEDVQNVARAGDVMPQKSTYFYPKLLTGLVLRVMDL